MKLWIDDIRIAPNDWHWVKTSEEAIAAFIYNTITEVSFDHDLGGEDTGYKVAEYIEFAAQFGFQPRIKWQVHSANPVGRKRIAAAMNSAERFWNVD